MNKIATLAVAAAALAAGVAVGWYLPKQQAAAPDAPAPAPRAGAAQQAAVPVETATVKRVTFPRGITAVGSLRSDETVMLRPEVAGRLREINFKEGAPVKKGQVLFRLDDAIARAELEQARANLALAQSHYKRAASLQAEGFISQQARDESANNLKVQQAAVALAQARLDKTVIVAPFDGIIGLRNVSIGDYVEEGQDLVSLEAVDPLKVDFRVPELYLTKVKVGQTLQVRFDALGGAPRAGTVYAISPLVDAGGRSILLRAQVDNADMVLRPGMFARVQLLVAEEDVLVVPEAALAPSSIGQYVYRIADGRARRVEVTIGERRDGQVEILSGLAEGDEIAIAGLQRLTDGAPVTTRARPS